MLTDLDFLLIRIAIPISVLVMSYKQYRLERRLHKLTNAYNRLVQEQKEHLRIQAEYMKTTTTRKTVVVQIGDIWKPKGHEVTWRVVSLRDNRVGVSGPGSARSMQYVEMRDFLMKWDLVSRDMHR